jgi:hypothetical protein
MILIPSTGQAVKVPASYYFLILMLLIQEVPDSSLESETAYPD